LMLRGCGRGTGGRNRSRGWWKCDGGVVVGLYRKECMDECTNLTPEALRNLTSLHFTSPFISPKTSPQPTNPYNPARALPLDTKRSCSLAVMTNVFSAVVHHLGGQVSYPENGHNLLLILPSGGRSIDLLLPVGGGFDSCMFLCCVLFILVVCLFYAYLLASLWGYKSLGHSTPLEEDDQTIAW
jgi:hypothetical protein